MSEKIIYDENYYKNYTSESGKEYKRNNGWEPVFANFADRIVKEIAPKKTLDVGCALGFLVEALTDKGVEAYGIDISEYAISNVRDDIKDKCRVQSATEQIEGKYDLITCIEVLEHLENKDVAIAIQQMCSATNDIIFSSTPFAYEDETHISIHDPAYWVEQFAYNGFYHDILYDCSYIGVQAMRFRRGNKTKYELIREYEKILFQKHQEVTALRCNLKTSQENVGIYKEAYQKHIDLINEVLNPQIEKLNKEISNEHEKNKIEQKKVFAKRCGNKIEQKEVLAKRYEDKIEEEIIKRKNVEETNCRLKIENAELEKKASILETELYKRNNIFLEWLLETCLKQEKSKKKSRSKIKNEAKKVEELVGKGLEYWKPVFDAEYYKKENEDVVNALGDDPIRLLRHYLEYGISEGRRGNEFFDLVTYISCNVDLMSAYGLEIDRYYIHYIDYGMKENRIYNMETFIAKNE